MSAFRTVTGRQQLLMRLIVRPLDALPWRRQMPFWVRILCVTPALIGLVTALLLAYVPQMHEVYRALVDQADVGRGLIGLFGVLVLGALLFSWNRDLNRLKIDRVYPSHADLVIDRNLFSLRHWKSLACAVLPVIGLTLGLLKVRTQAIGEAVLYAGVVERIDAARFPDIAASVEAMHRLAGGLGLGALITVAGGALLVSVLWIGRGGNGVGRFVYVIATLVTAVVALLPFVRSGAPSIAAAMSLGSLAMLAMLMIAVTGILIVMSRVSRWSGVPMITLVIAVGLYFTFSTLVRTVAIGDSDNASGGKGEQSRAGPSPLTKSFDDWLAQRADRRAYGDKPYPAFVFAIQGGGIYAASAGGAYLATLQDHCPALTQHIFAVSSVSGGSMGVAVYEAMAAGQRQVQGGARPSCGQPVTPPMAPRIQRVIQEDHVSPLMAFFLTDQLRKLDYFAFGDTIGLTSLTPDRADALETSFTDAFDRDLAAYPVNDYINSGDANRLRQPFETTWSPSLAAPAVLLNATSVEAGHRVVFAPFGLQDVGDGTLFSFSEIDRSVAVQDQLKRQKLIQAAGVSARIPGVVPSWSLVQRTEDGGRRWNFVDGGYADGSGASTAFDMFKVLEKHIRDNQLNVDLRLVLLTDSVAAPRFEDIDGGKLGDAILTVSTLMQMRRLLSVRAVTEAVTEVRKLGADAYGNSGEDRVFVSHLEHKTFPLSLGWRISPSTDSIVHLLIGRPDMFDERQCSDLKRAAIPDAAKAAGELAEQEVKIARAAETVRTNSCAMQRIIRLVAGR